MVKIKKKIKVIMPYPSTDHLSIAFPFQGVPLRVGLSVASPRSVPYLFTRLFSFFLGFTLFYSIDKVRKAFGHLMPSRNRSIG